MKYLALDKKTWPPFHRKACVEWVIVSRREDAVDLIEHRLFRTRDGVEISYKCFFLPERVGTDQNPYPEYAVEITKKEADALRAKIGARPIDDTPAIMPIVCSQAELGRQLGFGPNYPRHLEVLKKQGVVARFEPANPGRRLWRIWLADAAKHERVLQAVRAIPTSKRRRSDVERRRNG
jgi:hypothetical protein